MATKLCCRSWGLAAHAVSAVAAERLISGGSAQRLVPNRRSVAAQWYSGRPGNEPSGDVAPSGAGPPAPASCTEQELGVYFTDSRMQLHAIARQ